LKATGLANPTPAGMRQSAMNFTQLSGMNVGIVGPYLHAIAS
jgi:hypothetical protein